MKYLNKLYVITLPNPTLPNPNDMLSPANIEHVTVCETTASVIMIVLLFESLTCFGIMIATLLINLWDGTLILFVTEVAAETYRFYQKRIPPQNNSDMWSFVLTL